MSEETTYKDRVRTATMTGDLHSGTYLDGANAMRLYAEMLASKADDEITQLKLDKVELVDVLKEVEDVCGGTCRLDHHGYCQEHHLRMVKVNGEWIGECEMKLVRDAIAKHTPDARGAE